MYYSADDLDTFHCFLWSILSSSEVENIFSVLEAEI